MAGEPLLPGNEISDEEAIRRVLADPEVRERVRQALEQRGTPSKEPGVSAEELPRFLRELFG